MSCWRSACAAWREPLIVAENVAAVASTVNVAAMPYRRTPEIFTTVGPCAWLLASISCLKTSFWKSSVPEIDGDLERLGALGGDNREQLVRRLGLLDLIELSLSADLEQLLLEPGTRGRSPNDRNASFGLERRQFHARLSATNCPNLPACADAVLDGDVAITADELGAALQVTQILECFGSRHRRLLSADLLLGRLTLQLEHPCLRRQQ